MALHVAEGIVFCCTRSVTYNFPHEPGYFLSVERGRAVHICGGPWEERNDHKMKYFLCDDAKYYVPDPNDIPDYVWAKLAKLQLLGEL